jgi:ferredoxin-NADP reductase
VTDGLPALPSLGPVTRHVPPGGARRHWQPARVLGLRDETSTARTFVLQLEADAPRHVPGQHYDVRLTAPDGSQAQRSYSVASAPCTDGRIELTVERIGDGDVSPYLHDRVGIGDGFEVRGPFGGWFVWRGDTPALLVGGGSGVVPLMSMLRWWRHEGRPVPLQLVVSARGPDELFYAREYGPETTVVYTRRTPAGWSRPPARLDAATLDVLVPRFRGLPGATAYVCGSAGFAEHASQLLVELGLDPGAVRIERFGPA